MQPHRQNIWTLLTRVLPVEALDMIALTAGIAYRKENQRVVWRKNGAAPKPQPNNIIDTTVTKG